MPALNLAVCGETLDYTAAAKVPFLSLKAGYPVYKQEEGKDLFLDLSVPVCFFQGNPQVTSRNFMFVRNLNDCAPGLSNRVPFPSLGSYLAGLIEGDGTIVVPTTERSYKGKLNYASIQISFAAKDYPLVAALRVVLGHGSISKKSHAAAYTFTINNLEGLLRIVSLINGLLRTPKVTDFNNLIAYLNRKSPFAKLVPQPLNESPLSSNA